jgi:hypothetical protein
MRTEIILLFVAHIIASYIYVRLAKKYEWFELKKDTDV